jgi:hypothetical protein
MNNNGAPFQNPRDDTEEERLSAIEQGSLTPGTEEGNPTRGQLAHYAGAQHSMQFPHFSFSQNPKLMADFLWRLDHLSPRKRGHDESIESANLSPEVDGRVREELGIKDNNIPLYKYQVPGLKELCDADGPRPPTQNRLLVSRCTRNLPVVWIPTEDVNSSTRS